MFSVMRDKALRLYSFQRLLRSPGIVHCELLPAPPGTLAALLLLHFAQGSHIGRNSFSTTYGGPMHHVRDLIGAYILDHATEQQQ